MPSRSRDLQGPLEIAMSANVVETSFCRSGWGRSYSESRLARRLRAFSHCGGTDGKCGLPQGADSANSPFPEGTRLLQVFPGHQECLESRFQAGADGRENSVHRAHSSAKLQLPEHHRACHAVLTELAGGG